MRDRSAPHLELADLPRAAQPARVVQPERRTFRASLWTVGGYGASQALRFAGNLILTRLLFPDVFGLSALVYLFLQGLVMFSDVGLGFSVVQNPRGDEPRFLATAWTLQCIRGLLLALGAWAIAFPAAAFYHQPLLVHLLPAAGLSALIGGFESTSLLVAQRHMDVRRLTLVEVAAQVSGITVTIGLALFFRTLWHGNDLRAVWAVIGGGLTSGLVRVLLSHAALRGIRHRWQLDRASVGTLLDTGRWVFLNSLLTFLSGQSDRLVFARLVPLGVFGVYNIAATLTMVPIQLSQALSSKVLFPTWSRQHAIGEFTARVAPARYPLLLAGATMVSGLAATGPLFVRVVYDNRYAQAGWIIQFLAVTAWFQILETTTSAGLLAQGRMSLLSIGSAIKLAGVFGLVLLGFQVDGFRGALLGLIVSDAAKYAVSAAGIARHGLASLRLDLRFSALVVVVSALGTLAGRLAAPGGKIVALLAAGLVPLAFWGAMVLLWWRRRRAA